MAGRVSGKVVLLTGGAMGLGKAATIKLLAEGATVIITDIDEAAGRATAAELGCDYLAQDVTDWTRWQAVIAEVEAKHGRLDVLVNNAAITVFGSIADISVEDFKRCYTVDVDSLQGGDPLDGQERRRVDRQLLQRGGQQGFARSGRL
jgi:3(or 17)beta-hydroxysteroid dehydrogenase